MADYLVAQDMYGAIQRVPLPATHDWIEPGDVFYLDLDVYHVLALDLSWRSRIKRAVHDARRALFPQ